MLRNLSDRERYMVIGCVVFLLAVLVWRFAPSGDRDVRERRLAKATTDLAQMEKLTAEYSQLKSLTGRFEQMRSTGEDVNLITSVSKIAEDQGIQKISSKSPRTTPLDDQFTERLVEFTIQDATLGQVVGLLHGIERSKDGLYVRRLRVRPEMRDANVLNVSLSVVNYTSKAS
ncbi:MAG: type II secretion system protein M [Myxococcales bacterium]|nr:type II secretion system protein M [Myxococcales bacterium]